MRKFFLFLVAFTFLSFVGISSKKRISDSLFRYEFFTTDEHVKLQPGRDYFWFKGGTIHSSEYGTAGELLHNEFLKFYHDNQLAESGNYNKGLKVGSWKNWFKNGVLQSKVYWIEGQMDGSYFIYDHSGQLIEEGTYRNNRKHGIWINYVNKDTLKYRRGEIVFKKLKKRDSISIRKPGIIKRIFTKKSIDSTVAKSKAVTNTQSSSTKGFFSKIFSKKNKGSKEERQALKKAKSGTVQENKKSFFSRIFTKKNKSKNTDGKSK